jgi:DNA-binding response OmpR family regulator
VRARGPVILVVDDDDYVFEAIRVSLNHLRPDLCRASTVHEVVEVATRTRPDVAIVDVGLPDGDGYEVVRRLRAIPDPPGRIVILTGHTPDRAAAEAAGADAVLSKPYRVNELIAAILPLDSSARG